MRTSIGYRSLARLDGALLDAPVVEGAVGHVAQRDVEHQHEGRERDARGDLLLEDDRDQHREEGRGHAGALDRALPGWGTVHAVFAALARIESRLLLARQALAARRGRAAAVVRGPFDDAGCVAAVLA